MGHQGWQETLIAGQSDGTAVTGTSAGSLLPAQAKYILPANYLEYVGSKLHIRAGGRISNIVTTPGTLTLTVKFGSTVVATSQAMQLNAVAKTNVTWILDWVFDTRVNGTSAQLMHTGIWQSESVVGSGTGAAGSTFPGQFLIPATAPALGTAFDSTVSQVVDLQATFSLTGNSMQLHQYSLESMN
jgi:hypothetical protein